MVAHGETVAVGRTGTRGDRPGQTNAGRDGTARREVVRAVA